MPEAPIHNRVAESSLVLLSIDTFFPAPEALSSFDLATGLEKGMLLREKTFRPWLKHFKFSTYKDKYVALHCSTEAIVPPWAYMLSAAALEPYATLVCVGDSPTLRKVAFLQALEKINWAATYTGAKIIIKGCSQDPLALWAYTQLSLRLLPHITSLMYGEPCSTVPIYKKLKK